MKCPNDKTTELIEFPNPLMVPPTMEAEEVLNDTVEVGILKTNKFYQVIHRACPVCGYHETEEITEEEFANYGKEKK